MKKISYFLLFLLTFCSKPPAELDYNAMLKKHISDENIQQLFKKYGKDYKFVNDYGMHFYNYEDLNLELNFSTTDTLRKIYFKSDAIQIPYGLTIADTRNTVEDKIGVADTYEIGASNLIAYYFEKNLTVIYKTKDTLSVDNGVKQYTLSILNKEKILSR